MATYTPISIEQMRDFLKAEKGWKEGTQYREIFFQYNLIDYPHIVIKVYTGIEAILGTSRGSGRDAIRVCSVNQITNAGWIKANRVHRVEGWKNNLQARILKVIEQSKARIRERK